MKNNIPEDQFLLTEAIIKLSAMEKLLVKAGIFSKEQLSEEMTKLSEEFLEIMRKNFSFIKKDNN